VVTLLLLVVSNLFMTFAWYGHLKFKSWPLWVAVLASWGIAFFEYCLQVPANRWGHGRFCAAQLKIMQEVITVVVFTIFAFLYLGETPRWNYLVAYALIVVAVGFAFLPSERTPSQQVDRAPLEQTIPISRDDKAA